MMKKLVSRGSLALVLSATMLAGTTSTAVAAEIDWGTEDSGIITLDNDVTGVTYGEGVAPDKDTAYSNATEFTGDLSEDDRQRLVTALIIGQSIADGSFDATASEIIGNIPGVTAETVKDPLAEAVSDTITGILSGTGSQPTNPTVNSIMDYLENTTIGDDTQLAENVKILIAEPESDEYRNLVVFTGAGIPSLSDILDDITGDIQLRTSAGTEAGNVFEEGTNVIDKVRYTGLTPGQEYRLVGEAVIVNEDGSVQDDGANTGEKVFTPDSADGEVNVTIELTSTPTDKIVVFETLYDGEGNVVAEHKDVNDRAQTLTSGENESSIRTSADSNTGDYIQSGTVINDTVTYEGLIPGQEYRLEARLMCKETEYYTGGSASHIFTPDTESGTTVVEGITVMDQDCDEQVVYEKLYDNATGTLVASHEDINDAAQTIGSQDRLGKKKDDKKTPISGKGSPTPSGTGGGSPAPSDAPRQVINDMPSGSSTAIGSTIFTR